MHHISTIDTYLTENTSNKISDLSFLLKKQPEINTNTENDKI